MNCKWSSKKLINLWVIVVFLWIVNSQQGYAAPSNIKPEPSFLPTPGLSSFRNVGSLLDLSELGLEYWQMVPENPLTEKQLIQVSIRLRDIARFLGASWSIIIPLEDETEELPRKNDENLFLITDLRNASGEWITMSAGHALNLVSQELEILDSSSEEPLIDFLVVKEVSGKSYRLLGIPLSRYCYELFKVL
ncbi:MAG: hypothetical protein AB4352_28155 [Hormoscilla sp.]